ncbi:hypothetical protein Bca101_019802 [Brassica carinata]
MSQGQNSRRPEETMEGRRRKREKVIVRPDEDETPPDEVKPDDVKPVCKPVKVTGRGNGRRTHYGQFKYGGKRYKLEDSVLLNPEGNILNPYIAIIKDITKKQDGRMMILGQWFYREEEAKKKNGGNWKVDSRRELFYSFHRDEFPAESVMHRRCVVNFFPPHKQLPKWRDKRGFIVRKSVWRLGDLPNLETEEDVEKAKRSSQKVNITHVDFRKEKDTFPISSEYHSILQKFDSLTNDARRNKCLAKLLEAVQNICSNVGDEANDESFLWPDAAVPPVCAFELALYVSLASDYSKYNRRIRTLVFNLKEGLTDEETEKNEPNNAERMQMQMTDARCPRCSQTKVGLRDIFHAGHVDRYQLECIACGNSWYASRDEVSMLAVDAEQPARGARSEDVEKNLTSPPEGEKKATEDSLNTTNDSNADNNPEATKKPE